MENYGYIWKIIPNLASGQAEKRSFAYNLPYKSRKMVLCNL